MTGIHGSQQTDGTAYFCPKCHSPSVEVRTVGILTSDNSAPASCMSCRWSGFEKDLVQSAFKHEFKSDDEIADTMMRELRNLLSKTAAQSYGRFLLKWGFLDMPISGLQLAHYMDAIAKTVVRTIIETRKQLVEDKARERSGLSEPTGNQGR